MEGELRKRANAESLSFGRTAPDPSVSESEHAGDDDLSMDEFEFAFASVESDPGALTDTTADEIFSNGRILPVYPVFNRKLVAGSGEISSEGDVEERMGLLALDSEKHDMHLASESTSTSISSEADDMTGYCFWTPRSAPQSPDRWRMSRSTGSSEPYKLKLRDLIVGRSRSDGKEKLMIRPAVGKEYERGGFRTNPTQKAVSGEAEMKAKGGKGKGKGGEVKEMDVVTAYRIYYGKDTAAGRRSFLPYRQQLLGGFFGHGKHHHPPL